MKNNFNWKWIMKLIAPIILGVLIWNIIMTPPAIPSDKLPEKIDKINTKLTYLEVVKSSDITIIGEKKSFRYKIKTKDSVSGVYFFKKGKYDEMVLSDPTSFTNTMDFCDLFEELGTFNDPILEALLESDIKVKFPIASIFNVEIASFENILFELLYSLYEIRKIKANRIQVLLRGYADKAQNSFKDSLKKAPYHYDTIKMKPVADSDRGRHLYKNYKAVDSTVIIGEEYDNLELAYLRAHFIKEDVLGRTIGANDCQNIALTPEISVLEGQDFKNVEDKKLRKVDVYVNFYFKDYN